MSLVMVLHLLITFPTLKLPHLPPWFRKFLDELLKMLAIDVTGMVSSPECEWEFSTVGKYFMKMIFPLIILL